MLVQNAKAEAPVADTADGDGLNDGLVLNQSCVWRAVRPAESVADKVQVMSLFAEVTAVGPVLNTVGGCAYAVVFPLPDKAALQAVPGFH